MPWSHCVARAEGRQSLHGFRKHLAGQFRRPCLLCSCQGPLAAFTWPPVGYHIMGIIAKSSCRQWTPNKIRRLATGVR